MATVRDVEWINRDVEGYLAAHEQKELLRFVVVGSVDDGKSTLIGRLLYETDSLYEDQIAQVRKATKQAGEELDFSLFTDGLRAEREQGITIDVAYRYFSTATRKYIIADTPGHVQYTRNMATGASTADAAIILIDARLGVLAQSRRHAYIASLLGIPQLVVAINKMDLVDFDRRVFEQLRADFEAFASRLSFQGITFIPISAKGGDNIVAQSPRTPWHEGGTVLQTLEGLPLKRDPRGEALRLPVQLVLRPHLDYRGFAGQIASGELRVGDEVQVLPSGVRSKVRAIDTFEGEIERAFAPMSVTVRLEDEVDVSRGDVLVRPEAPATLERRFEATVVWLHERPLDPERSYFVQHTSRTVPARLERVHWRRDLETLQETPVERLELNDIGRVTVQCSRPLLFDSYARNRSTGAFIVIDALTNDTVGAGVIAEAAPQAEPREDAPSEHAAVLAKIEEALRGLSSGSITLRVENGVVVQLERTERIPLPGPEPKP